MGLTAHPPAWRQGEAAALGVRAAATAVPPGALSDSDDSDDSDSEGGEGGGCGRVHFSSRGAEPRPRRARTTAKPAPASTRSFPDVVEAPAAERRGAAAASRAAPVA